MTTSEMTTEQSNPYRVYLDNTFLMDLADATRERHREAERLVDLFKTHAASQRLQVRTSQWALAEASSVLYEQYATAAGHTDPSPSAPKRKGSRYFLPAHPPSVTQATGALIAVLTELQDHTDFILLPTGDMGHLNFWPLVRQIVVMGVGFPADCIHIASALEAECSLIISDDNDLLRKVDYMLESIIKPYWAKNFGDDFSNPPLTACGVGAWNNSYPGDGLRLCAADHLKQRGFV